MKPKFQPMPSKTSAAEKWRNEMPIKPTILSKIAIGATVIMPHAKAFDQQTGEKTGYKHAEHMPLQDRARRYVIKSAKIHGHRPRGHHEAHQAVRCRASQHRDDKARITQKLTP